MPAHCYNDILLVHCPCCGNLHEATRLSTNNLILGKEDRSEKAVTLLSISNEVLIKILTYH